MSPYFNMIIEILRGQCLSNGGGENPVKPWLLFNGDRWVLLADSGSRIQRFRSLTDLNRRRMHFLRNC